MTEKALKSMLELAHPTERIFQHHGVAMRVAAPKTDSSSTLLWIPLIQRTVATEGKGIVELAESIAKHVAHLTQSGDWAVRERARLEVELDALIHEELVSRFQRDVPQNQYESVLEKIIQRELSPGEAVRILMNGRLK
jgi:LAO/AO transport system kinase